MTDKRVTKEQLLGQLTGDLEVLAQKIADAINNADAGAIIDQSEEPVRQAHGEFRRTAYQKALSLLESNQQAFSPSAGAAAGALEEQGQTKSQLSHRQRSRGA